jgi:exonuclease III
LERKNLESRRKIEHLKKEMQKNAVSVLGVSEVWWKGQGEIISGDYTVYYSGGDRAERGVAIVVHKSIVKSVVKKSVCSDRIIVVKLKAEPVSILIVQVYMPTSDYEDDEVEELCDITEEILDEDRKGKTNTIIMGDWNSVAGDKAHHKTIWTGKEKSER